MQPYKPERIKALIREVCHSAEEENRGVRRFHLIVRVVDSNNEEKGLSVHCTPKKQDDSSSTTKLTAYEGGRRIEHWTAVDEATFLNHPWGNAILRIQNSAGSDAKIQEAFGNTMDDGTTTRSVTYYTGKSLKKCAMTRNALNELGMHCTVTAVEAAPENHDARTGDADAKELWSKCVEQILNNGWKTLCTAYTTIGPTSTTTSHSSTLEKSKIANTISDAFTKLQTADKRSLITPLSDMILAWGALICEPLVEHINQFVSDPRKTIDEVQRATTQIKAFQPFLDSAFFFVERTTTATQSSPYGSAFRLSRTLERIVENHLIKACNKLIGAAALSSIQIYRETQELGNSGTSQLEMVRQIFEPTEFSYSVQVPCQGAAQLYAQQHSQLILNAVRNGQLTSAEYFLCFFKQVRVERGIAKQLNYAFDQTIGATVFRAYLSFIAEAPGSNIDYLLNVEGSGIASAITTYIQDHQHVSRVVYPIAAACLPLPKDDTMSERNSPTGSSVQLSRKAIANAVTGILNPVHEAFAASIETTSKITQEYVANLVSKFQELCKLRIDIRNFIKSSECDVLREIASDTSAKVGYGRPIEGIIEKEFWMGVEMGVKESFKPYDKLPVYLAYFIDLICRGVVKNDETVLEEDINHTLEMGNLAESRDILMDEIKFRTAKRVLSKACVDMHGEYVVSNLETVLINTCRTLLSVKCSRPLEMMHVDVGKARALNHDFAEFEKATTHEEGGSAPFVNFLVLSSGNWVGLETITWKIPSCVDSVIDRFQRWYRTKQSNRKLDWKLGSWTGESQVDGVGKGSFIVTGKMQHLAVIHALATKSHMTMSELVAAVGGDSASVDTVIKEVRKYTGAAVKRKDPLIMVQNDSGKMLFSINRDYHPASKKVALNSVSVDSTRQTTTESIDAQRKAMLDALLVRIMKSRRAMPWSELVTTVMDQCKMFTPNGANIKDQISDLITRGYMRRSEENNAVLEYVA